MVLSLLMLSLSALFLLHLVSQRTLISQVRDYTEELSTAIDITQQQPAGEGNTQAVLNAYAAKLRQLGVRDVSFANEETIQASTNPKIVGARLHTKTRRSGPREIVIKGVLGEESGPRGSQKTSNLTIPIIFGDRRVGYVVITRILDDFSELAEINLAGQIAATLGVFAIGALISLFLAFSITRPLQTLNEAARRVAAGDLAVRLKPEGGDEIRSLTRTFNEMVVSLREKRLLEERLHFAERSMALGRLASAVAHEIRNPLNFINLSIDHLREQLGPEDAARREDFQRILGNVKAEVSRLNRLVGDFLAFGKPMRLDSRPCSIESVVRGVAALAEHKTKDQRITLTVEAEADLPSIVADAELLKTCLLNLIINAIDAMPDGGRLTLTVQGGRDSNGAVVLITVTDTGKGMTADEVETAFEPYFSTKDTGLGLGLALTRKIVGDHGGSITLESQPGHGTTARIVLPLEARPSADTEMEATA
jgi:signal transduction histidine kinase